MDKPKTTAKDFFLWAGAIVSFYWSTLATIFLIFNYLDYVFPDALTYYPIDPYQSGIPYQMASIIVLFPLFVFLMWLIRKEIERDPSRSEIWVRRWAIIFTLFLAGAAVAGDLITLLTLFLSGEELTTRFLLKVLVVLLVATGVFLHFISELRGYWQMFPKRRQAVSIGVLVLAVAVVGSGFLIVGTPREARLARFDSERVNDLQNIQYRIINYFQVKQELPIDLTDLGVDLENPSVPSDPQTGEEYIYEQVDDLTFTLCATFNSPTRVNYAESAASPPAPKELRDMNNWEHGSGEVCFERTIDPSFYPPFSR